MPRYNFQMSQDLFTYFKKESARLEIPMSALINVALQTYLDERHALKALNGFPDIVTRIGKLADRSDK